MSYFFYSGLDRYADGLEAGVKVKAGTVVAYVGRTGDAESSTSHLHFEIHHSSEEKRPVNPYPILTEAGGCGRKSGAVTASTS